jgi:hypothetical protein
MLLELRAVGPRKVTGHCCSCTSEAYRTGALFRLEVCKGLIYPAAHKTATADKGILVYPTFVPQQIEFLS